MTILNINEYLACKTPEEAKALRLRSKVNTDDMKEFVDTCKKQEELKTFQEAMPAQQYFELWVGYESKLKVKANSIKKNNTIRRSCEAYPEYKNILETHIALL